MFRRVWLLSEPVVSQYDFDHDEADLISLFSADMIVNEIKNTTEVEIEQVDEDQAYWNLTRLAFYYKDDMETNAA